MKRTIFLAGSAMALILSTGISAQAATCTLSAGMIGCTQADSDPVASAENNVTVRIDAAASVVSDDEEFTAVALSGDAVAIDNAGAIRQTDTGKGGYAITGSGDGMTVTNAGRIESGDRGIAMLGGSGLTVLNRAGATISARRQTIRADESSPGARVENRGTIFSRDGRALQLRSFGTTVINRGDLIGGEEVVEARGDFTLENHGTIRLNDPLIEDEDGVQFASGTVNNHGLIQGSDDGIDMDEGLIVNHANGVIRSTSAILDTGNGIDIDPQYDDEINPVRASGAVEIVNMGLIEGQYAIGADDAAQNEITMTNSGTLRGNGSAAVQLAPGQGDSRLNLLGNSLIYGDVNFGAGNDVIDIAAILSGSLIDDGVFDGGPGDDMVVFQLLELADFIGVDIFDDTVELAFEMAGDVLFGTFVGFDVFNIGGRNYGAAELDDALSDLPAPSAVPLPAGLSLLLAGLGGLALMRRRR